MAFELANFFESSRKRFKMMTSNAFISKLFCLHGKIADCVRLAVRLERLAELRSAPAPLEAVCAHRDGVFGSLQEGDS